MSTVGVAFRTLSQSAEALREAKATMQQMNGTISNTTEAEEETSASVLNSRQAHCLAMGC